ncbi:PIG-L family deacetylase [Streptomyces sp. SAS_270]|uniref:PIG-L family deacetylase n=1 Tax=Streptomyces sp. SAS_270 TaxID=3412748 RepID=UPI00403D3D0D
MAGTGAGGGLPDAIRRVLAVVAHPDDESFGLGGLLALLSDSGVPTAVLCFTHGEASTLHGRPGDLRTVRVAELACAARELGVERVELTGHPDGALDDMPLLLLAAEVTRLIDEQRPTHLLVFDTGASPGTGTINGPPAPRCSPPTGRASPSWGGPCRGTWRNG